MLYRYGFLYPIYPILSYILQMFNCGIAEDYKRLGGSQILETQPQNTWPDFQWGFCGLSECLAGACGSKASSSHPLHLRRAGNPATGQQQNSELLRENRISFCYFSCKMGSLRFSLLTDTHKHSLKILCAECQLAANIICQNFYSTI